MTLEEYCEKREILRDNDISYTIAMEDIIGPKGYNPFAPAIGSIFIEDTLVKRLVFTRSTTQLESIEDTLLEESLKLIKDVG